MDALSNDLLALTSKTPSNFTPSQASGAGRSRSSSLAGQKTKKSGAGAARANLSRPLEKEKATKMSVISGPIFFASSPSGDLQRSLESRLRARLALNGSLEYELIWKHSAIDSGVPICRLRASARRTSDNASTGWQTPRVARGAYTRDKGNPEDQRLTLEGEAHLANFPIEGRPTATAVNRERDAETMAKCAAFRKKNANQDTVPLYLGEVALKVVGWPTTTTRDSKWEGRDGPNRTGAPSLPEVAKLTGWATPQASDEVEGRRTDLDSPQKCLGRDLKEALGPILASSLARTGRRAALAPEFSLWLMGFPKAWVKAAPNSAAWFAVQAELESQYLKDLETQSSPISPSSSSELSSTQGKGLDIFGDLC